MSRSEERDFLHGLASPLATALLLIDTLLEDGSGERAGLEMTREALERMREMLQERREVLMAREVSGG